MNFIVYVDDAAQLDWVRERARLVADKHPSRLLVLEAFRHNGAEVATCGRESGGATVVTESVELAVGGLAADVIRSIAHSLTEGHIPTTLWWTAGELTSKPAFSELATLATNIVVDSSGSAQGLELVRDLATLFDRGAADLQIHDLAWMRLAAWREMIAQLFDEPALAVDLPALQALAIDAGSEAEAIYLAGWLASRLGWHGHDREFEAAGGHRIAFKLHLRGERRRVLRVELRSAQSAYIAELSDDDRVIALRIDGANAKSPWLVPLPAVDNASLIEAAILSSARDEHFEHALCDAAAIIG